MSALAAAPRYQPRGELEGLRILRGIRVSSPHQVDNWSTVAQETDFNARLEGMGAIIIPFDEADVSGRDMYKRRVFLRQLEKLDRGEADGLAYYDMERLTRHELARDAPIIAECLIRNRAIFVTWNRIYRLWLEADLAAFQQDGMYAGRDIRYRKHTMWRGIFGRAGQELIPMGKAPIGYRKRREMVHKSNGRLASHPELEKDPDQAEMMAMLVEEIDYQASLARPSLTEVCRRMNRAGHLLLTRRRKNRNGEVIRERGERTVAWRPNTILRMFDNPYYVGEFDFGRFSDRRSSVWENREDSSFMREAPELRYWTKAQLIIWRRRFTSEGRAFVPQSRKKKYDRSLIGVLACITCGRPMVSAGKLGYQCTTQRDGTCPKPQVLGERGALVALREILPDLLPTRMELLETAKAASDASRVASMEDEQRQLSAKQKADAADWMALPSPKPEALGRLMADQEQRLKTLKEELELARANALESQQAIRDALGLLEHTAEAFDALPPEAQKELYGLLVHDVQIEGIGIARGRRWRVVKYVSKLRENMDNVLTASSRFHKLALAASA